MDTYRGQLRQVDLNSGETRLIAQLESSLDNLALDAEDNIYVSKHGQQPDYPRQTRNRRAAPPSQRRAGGAGWADSSEDGKTCMWPMFALRAVDTDSGEVTDLRRAHGSDAEYPITLRWAVSACWLPASRPAPCRPSAAATTAPRRWSTTSMRPPPQ
ncbi:hypothetical protein UMZ34_00270 [Halopseudomonas pachastrellae]|nr:hypothetical protein UMZ34_00270 [Halopseudomonas pachastrellae]